MTNHNNAIIVTVKRKIFQNVVLQGKPRRALRLLTMTKIRDMTDRFPNSLAVFFYHQSRHIMQNYTVLLVPQVMLDKGRDSIYPHSSVVSATNWQLWAHCNFIQDFGPSLRSMMAKMVHCACSCNHKCTDSPPLFIAFRAHSVNLSAFFRQGLQLVICAPEKL